MNLKYYYPIWSIQDIPLADALIKIKEKGYDGAEYSIGNQQNISKTINLFEKNNLQLLAQHPFASGSTFAAYKKDYTQKLEDILKLKPIQVNCHTGTDYFSFNENLILLQEAEELSEKYGILVCHEIHRGRFSFAPEITNQYLQALPNLKLCADLSHWCVVTESYLENHSDFVNNAINHSRHIHARVGGEETPQVNDPFAPEHKKALEKHLEWWQKIYKNCHALGMNELAITCEFGPKPYAQTLPYTNQPVASIWEINFEMMKYLKEQLGNKTHGNFY